MNLKFREDVARDCVYESVRRTCSLITSFIQAWSIGLLKEELNNSDFLIERSSGLEVIPSSAPTLLFCGSNMVLIQTDKLKFVYVFYINSNYFLFPFCCQQSPYSWGLFCGTHITIFYSCMCSLFSKNISFSTVICRPPKVGGFFTFLTLEKGNGKDRKLVISRIPSPSVKLSHVLYLHFQLFWAGHCFFWYVRIRP